jgi:peptidoglycan/xylan/chitin deacetylase (PgdA/CDA1 family)
MLDESFEIGSHGVSHVPFTTLPRDAVCRELRDSKAWLEEHVGHDVKAFAYPFGGFSRDIASLVASEGYASARTCLLNRSEIPKNPYLMGMTTDACAHSRRAQLAHGIRERNLRGLLAYATTYRLERDWEVHFRRALRAVGQHGGIAHLVVHSVQIARRGEWDKLDRVLAASATSSLQPATNTEALFGTS